MTAHLDRMNSIADRAARDYRNSGRGLTGPAPKVHRRHLRASGVRLLVQTACLATILGVVLLVGIFMGAL